MRPCLAALTALRREDGFGLIELMVATVIITVALLALVAGYDAAAVSLTDARLKATASALANKQMELYSSLPFSSIGLDATTFTDLTTATDPGYDSLYATNPILSASDVSDDATISGCGSSPQCSPVQTVTGPDGHSYRIETYIVDLYDNSSIGPTERVVTVVVQDAEASGDPELTELTSGFDRNA